MAFRFITQSIGRKLGVSFLLMILLTVVVGGIGWYGINSIRARTTEGIDNGIQSERLSTQINNEISEARRLEQEYLLRLDEFGLEAARAEFIVAWQSHIDNAYNGLGQMAVLEQDRSREGEASRLDLLTAAIGDYESGFNDTVALIEQRGLVDEGVIGSFRNDVNNIETALEALNDQVATNIMLQIRRREKDYMLRGDQTYVEDVRVLVDELKAHIATESINPLQRDTIIARTISYESGFLELVSIDQEIEAKKAVYRAAVETCEPLLAQMQFEGGQTFADATEDIFNTVDLVEMMIVIALGVALILGLALSGIITRLIVRPLISLIRSTEAVSAGDLSARAHITTTDETGQLGAAFNEMVAALEANMSTVIAKEHLEQVINNYREFVSTVSQGDLARRLDLRDSEGDLANNDDLQQLGANLNAMVENLSLMARQVRETVNSVTSAATEIQAAATQQTASATEQNATVTQTVATVEEVRQTVQQTAERARMVAENASKSMEVSQYGQRAVESTVEGMNIIRERVGSIAESILMLSERTQQIGEIIDTVNGLADQSKLLSLNASIEAARAGEEGKGFAVVAMEVRQLAEQSRDATARVQGILNEIQQATNSAVMVTEEGSKGAEQGMTLVEQAGLAIRELAATIEEAAQAASQIAASTQQQTNGMDQLSVAMTQIEQATAQATATAQQTEVSVRDLLNIAHQLESAVARYQL